MVFKEDQSAVDLRKKVLYKGVCDAIKKLDVVYKSGKLEKTLFSHEAYSYRLRLKVSLLKLIISDPIVYGSKCEDILWRKVFYEPIHLFKLFCRELENSPQFAQVEASLKMHLTSALGFYQTLLLKFQADYYKPSVWSTAWRLMDLNIISAQAPSNVSIQISKIAEKMCQKFLIYLGDLYRYNLDVGDFHARRMGYNYYQMASLIDPNNGSPHNQLGTLDVGRCYGLNSVYHYLRSVVSVLPFDGAKGNLATVLLRNEARFLNLQEGKHSMPNLQSQVLHRKAAIKLKDFCFTIIKFLYFLHRNAQSFLKPKANKKLGTIDQSLMKAILDDISFVLRSETKRYGAKCVAHMMPNFDPLDDEDDLPDFCPDPKVFARQKTASTPLMSPITVRMLLTNLLMIHFLLLNGHQSPTTENEDNVDSVSNEALENRLLERSGELVHFTLSFLDLLLSHAAQALTKTVNMFKLEATRSLRAAHPNGQSGRANGKQTRRKRCQQQHPFEEKAERQKDGVIEQNLETLDALPGLQTKTCEPQEAEEATHASSISSDNADESSNGASLDRRLRRRIRRQTGEKEGTKIEGEAIGFIERSRCVGYSNRPSTTEEINDKERDFLQYPSGGSDFMHGEEDGFEDSEGMSESDGWYSEDSSQLHSQNSDSFLSQDEDEEAYHSASQSASGNPNHSLLLDSSGSQIQTALQPITEEEGDHYNIFVSEDYRNSRGVAAEGTSEHSDVDAFEDIEENENKIDDKKHEEQVKINEEEEPNEEMQEFKQYDKPKRGEKTDVWLRLFVAGHFVDSLLAGVKLLSDWLPTSASIILLPRSDEDDDPLVDLRQQMAWHLAGLLNYLNPIVLRVEREIGDSTVEQICQPEYIGLPIDGILSSEMLPCLSIDCRKAFHAVLSAEKTENNVSSPRTAFVPPLPEDWLLRGLPLLASLHEKINFESGNLPIRIEESLLRCLRLVQFGRRFADLAHRRREDFHVDFNYHVDSGSFTASPPQCVLPRPRPSAKLSRPVNRSSNRQWPASRAGLTVVARRAGGASGDELKAMTQMKTMTASSKAYSLARDTAGDDLEGLGLLPDLTGVEKLSQDVEDDEDKSASETKRGEMMRKMAHLRLKDQVETLRRDQACRGRGPPSCSGAQQHNLPNTILPYSPPNSNIGSISLHDVSPYLVLDTFCLIGHLPFVKRLLASQKYVLVVPQAVIAHLDYLKKTTATARFIIRFLEEQTHNGNRHLRMQTEDEGSNEPLELSLSKTTLLRGEVTKDTDSAGESDGDSSILQTSSRVVYRWLNVFDCAVFFSQLWRKQSKSDEKAPVSSWVPPEAKVSAGDDQDEDDAIEASSSANSEVVNILKHRIKAIPGRSPRPTVTVLIGSRTATQKDLLVPLQLLRLAHSSGIAVEPILEFAQRWKSQPL